MDGILDATRAFFDGLASVKWVPLALAMLCHLLKVLARTRAWRNIVQAAYPEANVRWRSVYGSYVAGVGVNAIVPARGGDVLKLYLLKHRVEGSAYPTLGATLIVDTLFDTVLATALVAWALAFGFLPGLNVIPRLPPIDWLYLFQHPRLGLVVAALLLVSILLGLTWGSRKVKDFGDRVRQGFTILREPREYLQHVALWDAVDWSLRLASVYFFLLAFGLPGGAQNVALVQTTMSLSTALPFTPGGVGTEQALLVYVFQGDAPTSTLLSFSIGMKIVLTVVNVVIGFLAILLMLRTFDWRGHTDRDADAIERA
jgi:glycosyltransferase 2 family protein